jgi:malate/lactate dehydrogenase
MGVPSDGSYGIPAGIVFGFPCECKGGSFKIIQGLEIDEYSREKINFTLKELTDEAPSRHAQGTVSYDEAAVKYRGPFSFQDMLD